MSDTRSAEEILAAVRDQLFVTPCHITGMHDPTHTTRYVCDQQATEMLTRLLTALGTNIHEMRHALHSESKSCYWCHVVPGQEKYREELRQLWRWAGVGLTRELAADAPDKPQPGDTALVYQVMPEDFVFVKDVEESFEDFPSTDRFYAAVNALIEQGLVEREKRSPGNVRRVPKEA